VKSSLFDTSASNNVKNVLQSCFYIQLVWYTLIANSLFICNRHHARSLRTGGPSLYFPGEEKRRLEICLRSQAITFAFSAEFLQFWGEVACSRLLVGADEREKRASSEKASGRKEKEERRGETGGILTNIIVHQLPRPLPEKPFFVSKWQEFKCQNAPSRRDRETSYSVPIHPHVIIWVGTRSIFLFIRGDGQGWLILEEGSGTGILSLDAGIS